MMHRNPCSSVVALATSAVALALLSGCAGGSATTSGGQTPASEAGTPLEQLDPLTVEGYSTSELVAEFERARSFLLVDKFTEAASAFDRLMKLADDPELKALAMYNSGLAHQGLGDQDTAVARYRTLNQQYPDQPIAKHGQVRLTRVLGYLEKWAELQQEAARLLAFPNLPVMDQIEAHGAHALAKVELGDLDGSRLSIEKAQKLIEEGRFGQSGIPPVQLAQVAFAEGEIRRIRSEEIRLTPVPPNFGEVLEARCQGLLDAQSAYTDAMRARDPHWSAMSGYRVGQLYHQLHREAMDIPPPTGTSTKQQQLFAAAMRLRYRILLEKGLRMMNGTLALGQRTGENSFWIARAKESKRQLEQALADENAVLEKAPYSEEEIKAALDKLKGKSKAKP